MDGGVKVGLLPVEIYTAGPVGFGWMDLHGPNVTINCGWTLCVCVQHNTAAGHINRRAPRRYMCRLNCRTPCRNGTEPTCNGRRFVVFHSFDGTWGGRVSG